MISSIESLSDDPQLRTQFLAELKTILMQMSKEDQLEIYRFMHEILECRIYRE
jgi:hypothetical protein